MKLRRMDVMLRDSIIGQRGENISQRREETHLEGYTNA